MPGLDMPLGELKKYTGISPRPDDFDAYWDRCLKEMKALDSRVELVPADFQIPGAECYDLWFTGMNGARIYSKYIKPKNPSKPMPLIIKFHGYTGHSGEWSAHLEFLGMGYAVVSMDCRGQAGKSEDIGGHIGNTFRGQIIRGLNAFDPDKLLFRDIFLDTAQLAGIMMDMEDIDETRVGVQGGSQGGALSLVCAALEPRIKLASVQYPFLCDYKRVWEMELPTGAYEELFTFFRMYDPLHEREEEVFRTLSYIDVMNLASRIKAKVMMGVGLRDTTCPPSCSFAAYSKINSEKQMLIYPEFSHEGLTGYWDKSYQFMLGL